MCAGVEVPLRELDRLANIAGPLGLERFDAGGATSAELNPDLRLRLQACLAHRFGQPQEVVDREGDEAAQDLDDVEAELLAFLEVARHRVAALGEHVFEEAARRDLDIVLVSRTGSQPIGRVTNPW